MSEVHCLERPVRSFERTESGTRSLADVRRQQILDYLEHNATEPDLTPAFVARRFGISKRYLHKLLSEHGTSFHATLLRLRLQRCFEALARTDKRRTVAEIAFDAGFSDLSSFNRRFRAAYGIQPRRVRALAA